MAILFDRVASETLNSAAWTGATGVPFTLTAWVNPDDETSDGTVVSIGDVHDTNYHALYCREGGGVYFSTRARSFDGGLGDADTAVLGPVAGIWTHIAGVWVNDASRKVYMAGTNEGTDNTNIGGVVNIDNVCIGATADSTPIRWFDGMIGEVAIWAAALSQVEILALAKGASPLMVRPASLVGYWPLGRLAHLHDRVGGFTLTANNGPAEGTSHPAVLRPHHILNDVYAIPAAPAAGIGQYRALLGVGV